MKIEARLFYAGVIFFVPLGIVYGWLTSWTEPVGLVSLILTGGLAAMIGFYLYATGRRLDPRPEDDPVARIAGGAGEQGSFAPWSWWPLAVAISASLVFLGLALGFWISLIGMAFATVAVMGWVFEYYRGIHAH